MSQVKKDSMPRFPIIGFINMNAAWNRVVTNLQTNFISWTIHMLGIIQWSIVANKWSFWWSLFLNPLPNPRWLPKFLPQAIMTCSGFKDVEEPANHSDVNELLLRYIKGSNQCEPSFLRRASFGHHQKDVTYFKIKYPKKVKYMVSMFV